MTESKTLSPLYAQPLSKLDNISPKNTTRPVDSPLQTLFGTHKTAKMRVPMRSSRLDHDVEGYTSLGWATLRRANVATHTYGDLQDPTLATDPERYKSIIAGHRAA